MSKTYVYDLDAQAHASIQNLQLQLGTTKNNFVIRERNHHYDETKQNEQITNVSTHD